MIPIINVNSKDVKIIKDYNELNSLADVKDNVVIVRNILRAEGVGQVRLIGRLVKEKGEFFIKGMNFSETKEGKHEIIGCSYKRDSSAIYGISKEEFETRHPVYVTDAVKRKEILSDLEKMAEVPFALDFGKNSHL